MVNHFEGKSAEEHVKEARKKGAIAASEVHGAEMSGSYAACIDASKDSALGALILWTAVESLPLLFLFACGWLLWKTGRSALLGWARLERLHRLIEDERLEIEHHRGQEKEELKALYSLKGFKDKLLDDVIEVLMADDDRLLQVMLEEELGLTLEAYEHPLKQALGAFIGSAIAFAVIITGSKLFSWHGTILAGGAIIIISATAGAKLERNAIRPALIWNLSLAALSIGTVYFLKSFFV